jgi:hypothetical protein
MPIEKGTTSMRSSSHGPDRISVTSDNDHAVANDGLIQPATLADHLGLLELFDEFVHLGAGTGHANLGLKAMILIYFALPVATASRAAFACSWCNPDGLETRQKSIPAFNTSR